ncbi:MAG: hypothetical protein QXQ91_05060 [Nanopusillaceae archaeon]
MEACKARVKEGKRKRGKLRTRALKYPRKTLADLPVQFEVNDPFIYVRLTISLAL